MIVSDAQNRSVGTVNTPLVALLAEARELHQALLASPEHNLAACIAGTQPVSLTTKLLLNIELPICWM